MTAEMESRILDLRYRGFGYKSISKKTDCTIDAVKWVFKKYNYSDKDACLMCHKKLEQIPHKKKKKFCSDTCRMKWWNSHPEMVQRKTETKTCEFCDKQYPANRTSSRFCSKECYASFRKKQAED